MNWQEMLFQSWSGLLRTVVVGVLAYVALIVLLRFSGKRTLAKLNAFDLVITVALGSTLSAILLQESVSLTEGTTAIALLIGMQYSVTRLSIRFERFASWVRSDPVLLVRAGQVCTEALQRERVTLAEVMSAIRGAGGTDLSAVDTVILENNGTFSVALLK